MLTRISPPIDTESMPPPALSRQASSTDDLLIVKHEDEFTTAGVPAALARSPAKVYWEATIIQLPKNVATSGVQWGWCGPNFERVADPGGKGVGDTLDSWALFVMLHGGEP